MLLSKSNRAIACLLYFTCFAVFASLSSSRAQDILINEFLASNASTNWNWEFQAYSDWIEIYNARGKTVDLGGYYLTDNLEDSTKWQVPVGVTIEPNGFALFWADGNRDQPMVYHTNFKLQKGGEEIAIFSPEGELIDSVIYENQITDVSRGRQPDGSSAWVQFAVPSPNATNNHSGIFLKTSPPEMSLAAGFYAEEQVLYLSANAPDEFIRYTLNGDEPTETSPIYSSPLLIMSRAGDGNMFSDIPTNADPYVWLPSWRAPGKEVFKATVVRARIYREGYLPSNIATRSYFVDTDIYHRYPAIPVISIVSDYKHLFADSTGIYVAGETHRGGQPDTGNYFQDWEKPAHIEFFELGGVLGFSQDVGIKIQGGTSRSSPQKGLHVIARSIYGKNRIQYPIFETAATEAKDLTEFKRFIIRAWGTVIQGTLITDAYAHELMAESGLDVQAYRPAVLFINGEYWGLHELREANKNSWYYQYHHGVNRGDPGCDILVHAFDSGVLGGGTPVALIDEGDAIHWDAMIGFINSHDMSLSSNYEHIKTQVDIDNFITYMGYCVYCGKWDWPNNNEASWRPRTPDGRWKWIQYDMETCFGNITGNTFGIVGPDLNMIQQVTEGLPLFSGMFPTYGPHPILTKLLANSEFNDAFVTWFDDQMNSVFLPDSMEAKLDEVVAELSPYMPEFKDRWPFIPSVNTSWASAINQLKS